MKKQSEPIALDVFKGYTVDAKLREFRKMIFNKTVESIPFDSEEGQLLQRSYLRFCADEFQKLLNMIEEASVELA